MKLIGIEVANLRSIGEQGVTITPLRKCNILVGQNNAGKSNVIRAVQRVAALTRRHFVPNLTNTEVEDLGQIASFTSLDYHQRNPATAFKYKLIFLSGE